jgi:hypothetical protein
MTHQQEREPIVIVREQELAYKKAQEARDRGSGLLSAGFLSGAAGVLTIAHEKNTAGEALSAALLCVGSLMVSAAAKKFSLASQHSQRGAAIEAALLAWEMGATTSHEEPEQPVEGFKVRPSGLLSEDMFPIQSGPNAIPPTPDPKQE